MSLLLGRLFFLFFSLFPSPRGGMINVLYLEISLDDFLLDGARLNKKMGCDVTNWLVVTSQLK
jgi:hypothetical protein